MLQPKLLKVDALPDMQLVLYYETGEKKLFDVTPYATGSWYSELKDPKYFVTVRIIANGSGIEWPDGQDIAPHELYDLGKPLD